MDSQQAAMTLARQGDIPSARAMLRRLGVATGAGADPWLALAAIERHVADTSAEREALFEALRRAPRHLAGLLARGELERRAGDARTAMRFFRTALATAAVEGAPPQMHAALGEAQRFAAETSQGFATALIAAVEDAGVDRAGPRVAEAIDLLLGRKELFVQQPSMFYFPGTAQRAVFDREAFDWVPALEAKTGAIRDELAALLEREEDFAPYIQSDAGSPPQASDLLDSADWSALHLFRDGQPHPDNAARCPATMAALGHAPMPHIGTRSPMALFSRLKPGAHIKPHHGLLNTRLICHLPLIVPPGCGIRIGAEQRDWREGELLIFDDSFEHEAWNRGATNRVVLLFEIWRPDIDEAERAAITALLAAVGRHGALEEGAI